MKEGQARRKGKPIPICSLLAATPFILTRLASSSSSHLLQSVDICRPLPSQTPPHQASSHPSFATHFSPSPLPSILVSHSFLLLVSLTLVPPTIQPLAQQSVGEGERRAKLPFPHAHTLARMEKAKGGREKDEGGVGGNIRREEKGREGRRRGR